MVRGPARGECTGVPSGRGERYRCYTDEQKQAAVDHYLEYGRRPGRTMRMLGYPKSKELLMARIDELAPGQRKPGHGPVPEELKRKAVVAVAPGRPESREAAAELGVEASVVGKPETADPADTLASMKARLARLQARLDELDADIERQRREKKEPDIEIAIRKGTLELSGKRAGRRPGKARPAARRRSSSRPLAKRWA